MTHVEEPVFELANGKLCDKYCACSMSVTVLLVTILLVHCISCLPFYKLGNSFQNLLKFNFSYR